MRFFWPVLQRVAEARERFKLDLTSSLSIPGTAVRGGARGFDLFRGASQRRAPSFKESCARALKAVGSSQDFPLIGRRFKNDTERLEKLFEFYARMIAAKD